MARTARRFVKTVFAIALILAGIAMLVLPGPGLVSIAVGFGILGRELRWAWVLRAESRVRATLDRLLARFRADPFVSAP